MLAAVAARPREGPAVVGVGQALHAQLVPVVDAWDAEVGHLHENGEPEAPLRKAALTVREAPGHAVGPGLPVGMVECAAQHTHEAWAVVAREQVERRGLRLGRVVLGDGDEALGSCPGAHVPEEKPERSIAERVVHGAVELAAQEVATQLAVAHLVGGILPDLAEHERVRTLGRGGRANLLDELVGQLVCHVKAPTARAGGKPVAHDAVLARDELAIARVLLVHGRQVVHAPPALVRAVLVPAKPIGIGRVRALLVGLPGAGLPIGAVAVEVAAVCAHVVEHAVEHDGDAQLGGLVAQHAEAPLVTEHGVDGKEVRRVVAVAAARLEDGVEVERRDAHVGQAREVVADAEEGAAIEVPRGDAAGGVPLVGGLGVPPLHDAAARAGQTVLGVVAVQAARRLGKLAPVGAPAIAIGEHLVDDARGEPCGLHLARLIDRELERRRLPLAERALAARAALARAVVDHAPVRALDEKRVPQDRGSAALVRAREPRAVPEALGLHGRKALAHAVDPRAQRGARPRVATHVEPKHDGAAHGGGTERIPIEGVTAVVIGPHAVSSLLAYGRRHRPHAAAGAIGSVSCCTESPRDGGHGRHPGTGWRPCASQSRPSWHCPRGRPRHPCSSRIPHRHRARCLRTRRR